MDGYTGKEMGTLARKACVCVGGGGGAGRGEWWGLGGEMCLGSTYQVSYKLNDAGSSKLSAVNPGQL